MEAVTKVAGGKSREEKSIGEKKTSNPVKQI